MKITDVKVWPTRVVENRSWIFIEVNTDEGITGFGEATNSEDNHGRNAVVGKSLAKVDYLLLRP